MDAAGEFEARVEPILETMLRLARRLGRDHAEDIVQDALARAWAKRQQFDPALGSFSAWLLAITADQAYKTWRWHARRDQPVLHEAREHETPEARLDLERSIGKLPDRQRLAVDCFYFAGLSIAETAAVMGCSEGTVKSTLFDARATLRALLR
jgi:RNA polymerase sigma-70 factor, ECF subfamily